MSTNLPPDPRDEEVSTRGRLTRLVKVQLTLFLAMTLAGAAYVGANYAGLGRVFGSGGCTVHVDLPSSGGIFTDAEVTYRGVTVGQVGHLRLIEGGVQADLRLDDCDDPKIPAATAATVADRSVIGEQYVNLVPASETGPYLEAGDTIPRSRTSVPVAPQQLLGDLDGLVNSVDLDALRTTVRELGAALDNRGPDLGRLLDSTNALVSAARANLPQTVALLDSARTVLGTQLDEGDALAGFTRGLRLLSGQLRASDPDIRALLDRAPHDLAVVRAFVTGNRTDLGVVLANLATTGETLVRRLGGLRQILELYPQLAAGGMTAIRPDGIERLGIVLNVDDPPDCGDPKQGRQGYDGTVIRPPSDLSPQPPNVAARCTAPPSSGINVRGSANVPGGDPVSATGGDVAYPRVRTGNTGPTAGATDLVRIGAEPRDAAVLGDRSWLAILTTALV